jgi:hypothetical protein
MFLAPLAAVTIAALAVVTPAPMHDAAHDATFAHRIEVARIQLHFDSVLAVLRFAERPELTPGQRVRRAALFTTLQQYRDAGVFPHNHDFGQAPVPYFIDRHSGVYCAVAYLMRETGRADIAQRVAAMDNNVYVADLAGDTAFTSWLTVHGLTLAEAAWIQVPYVSDFENAEPTAVAQTSYGVVSLSSTTGAATLALVNAFTNRDGHGRARKWLGLGLGTLSLGVAAMGVTSDAPGAFVAGNAIAGTVSIVSSAKGFIAQRRIARAERENDPRRVSANVMPILPSENRGAGAGVSFAVTF